MKLRKTSNKKNTINLHQQQLCNPTTTEYVGPLTTRCCCCCTISASISVRRVEKTGSEKEVVVKKALFYGGSVTDRASVLVVGLIYMMSFAMRGCCCLVIVGLLESRLCASLFNCIFFLAKSSA